MPRAKVNGIEIEYEVRGGSGPWILLVMGLGQQLVAWPDALVDGLVKAGFRVLRYDHRDTGLSTKTEGDFPSLAEAFTRNATGLPVPAPYTLEDLADDAFGLLDHLEAPQAHVVGVSMGGMVAQLMAVLRPDRVPTLTSVMSTTGERHLPPAQPAAMAAIAGTRPESADREALISFGMGTRKILAGPRHPTDEPTLRAYVARMVDRMWYPAGVHLHTLAVLASGDRVERLKRLAVPTLVLHGEADPLVPVAHGIRTAELVPGAVLKTFEGWGHDLPPSMVPALVAAIAAHAVA